jgi:hypothetical protein
VKEVPRVVVPQHSTTLKFFGEVSDARARLGLLRKT